MFYNFVQIKGSVIAVNDVFINIILSISSPT